MKFSNKKFLLLVGALAFLFSMLAFATWYINSNSTRSDIVEKTSSGSVHSSAESESLELSDSFLKHMEPLMKMFQDRINLLTDTTKLNASAATEESLPLANSNAYVNLNLVQVNTYQDLLNVKARINATPFIKDFADKACPMSPAVLSSSGTLMTPAASRELLMHYYIQSSPVSAPMHYISHSSSFGIASEAAKDMYLEGIFSITDLAPGTYTLTAIPGCMTPGADSEIYPAAALQQTFEKKAEPLEVYTEENNSDALLKILSPTVDTKTPGEALREISYTTSHQEKVAHETLSIPYIQTESTLQIKAESILPQGALNASGALLQEKKYYTQFSLYDKNGKLAAMTESQKVATPLKSTKTTWYGYFSQLPKGEYTLITRLILESTDADNTMQEITKRSKVAHIGIGDIYMAVGDSTLTGYSGETWGDVLGTDTLEGRNKAQPTKECEVAQFFKNTCTQDTTTLYGLTSHLGKTLSEKKEYPVLVLSEGMPQALPLDKTAQYIAGSSTGLKARFDTLAPTGILLQVSAHSLPENAKNNLEEMKKIFRNLKDAIASLKGAKNIPVYYALPQYEEGNPVSETFALEFKKFASENTDFTPGPNLYKLFFEKLLSEKSSNLYKQTADEKIMINDLGLREVADLWAQYIR